MNEVPQKKEQVKKSSLAARLKKVVKKSKIMPFMALMLGLVAAGMSPVHAASAIPVINLTYDLGDIATSIANWFSSFWPIIAFATAIPLSFMIAHRTKNLFVH